MLGVLAQVRDLYPGRCVCVCEVLGALAQVRGLYPGRGWPKKTHAIPSLKDQILGPSLAQHSVVMDLDTQMQLEPTVYSLRAERLGPGHSDGGGGSPRSPWATVCRSSVQVGGPVIPTQSTASKTLPRPWQWSLHKVAPLVALRRAHHLWVPSALTWWHGRQLVLSYLRTRQSCHPLDLQR